MIVGDVGGKEKERGEEERRVSYSSTGISSVSFMPQVLM